MSIGHALKWSFLSELAAKAIQPVVFVVLARLLVPEDFGVVAAAMMVISFSQIFWEAGMGKALIQYQGDRTAAANSAFWINCSLGVLVAGALLYSSELIAETVFHDTRVAAVLKVMSLQVLLAAAGSVHTALLQKDMKFKKLFWVRFATVSMPGIISIPLAIGGMGYWALVAGTLTGQCIQLMVLWQLSSWRPSWDFHPDVSRRLISFGYWVAATGLLTWFYAWSDSLIVGMYLGAWELGIYRTGSQFVMMLYGLMFSPLLPVIYSYFSGIQHDVPAIKTLLLKIIRIITLVSVPSAFFIYAISSPMADVLFGDNWQGIGLVISVMALLHGFSWVVGVNGEVYRAIGHPEYETKIIAGTLLIYLLGYWISIRFGLHAFLWTRLGLAIIAFFAHLWLVQVALGLKLTTTLPYVLRFTMIGIPLVLLGHNIDLFGESLWLRATGAALVASVWLVTCMYAMERKRMIPELVNMVLRRNSA